MGKKYLVAVDLEGVYGIVGEPYKGLGLDCSEYQSSTEHAVEEVNAVVKGLFEGGAEAVAVWDNHGGRDNLDFSKIDNRVVKVRNVPSGKYVRLGFADDWKFDGILYIGYHAKEGSLNGVLAHTYNSKAIQYYKVNGVSVGELDIDSWAAAERGIAPLFCSSDKVGTDQALSIEPKMQTVITKYGTGRNTAIFRDKDEVLEEMYEKALACTKLSISPRKLTFPAKFEIRYTRAEDAEKKLKQVLSYGQEMRFGEDSHTLVGSLRSFADLEDYL